MKASENDSFAADHPRRVVEEVAGTVTTMADLAAARHLLRQETGEEPDHLRGIESKKTISQVRRASERRRHLKKRKSPEQL
jgi:hypothetical protein